MLKDVRIITSRPYVVRVMSVKAVVVLSYMHENSFYYYYYYY
jgi:hypothetical protein